MAIGTHVGTILRVVENRTVVYKVEPNDDIPNSATTPTLYDYIQLEATDNYIVNYLTPTRIITINAVDLNNI